MKYLFYCGHPAQYLFFRETIRQLNDKGHKCIILIKTKDVLEDLLISDGLEYVNIQKRERGRSKLSIALSLIRRNLKILPIIIKHRPDILIGGDPSVSQLGWMLRKMRFTLTEDDYPVIKTLARITFPFAQAIVTPEVNNVGDYQHKKVGYNGYMKLAYLHPKIFVPDPKIPIKYGLDDKYAIIRMAKLTAHHDFGIKGLTNKLLDELIEILEQKGIRPYVSSEALLDKKYKDYNLNIHPADMHHILAQTTILISDSQSMSVEAAILGVPSIRYSTFAGKISVLEELEHRYELTFGVPEGKNALLIHKINELLNLDNLFNTFRSRRQKMLSEKINVTTFMVWFIENYPKSIKIMKKDPLFQYRFK